MMDRIYKTDANIMKINTPVMLLLHEDNDKNGDVSSRARWQLSDTVILQKNTVAFGILSTNHCDVPSQQTS